MTKQEQNIYAINLVRAVKAGAIIIALSELDLDDFSIYDIEELQAKSHEILKERDEKLAEHLKQFPD